MVSGWKRGNSEEYLEDYRGFYIQNKHPRRSIITDFPGGQWLIIHLPMQRDVGSTCGPGGFHMLQSNWACVQRLLSLCSGSYEPQQLSPHTTTIEAHMPKAHALQQEATTVRSLSTSVGEQASHYNWRVRAQQ